MRLMRKLEAQGRLDRAIEYLPSDTELTERRKAGQGPHPARVAVLLAYCQDDALRGPAEDRAARSGLLGRGRRQVFPAAAASRAMPPQIEHHRLKREIVATWIANSVVNRGLDVFVSELEDETGGTLEDVLLAYIAARDAFKLLPLWSAIEAVPASVPGEVQTRLLVGARGVLVRGNALVHDPGRPSASKFVMPSVRFRPGIATVMEHLDQVIGGGPCRRHGCHARANMSQLASRRSWPAPLPGCPIC